MDGPKTAGSGRVLLVDDEATLLAAMRRVYTAAGFQVTACSNGADALTAIYSQSFDVIVSDISMPKLGGIELLRAIRQRDLDVPVILMSGAATVESAVEAVDLGAFKYLMKPLDQEKLLSTTTRAVQLYRLAMAKQDALSVLGGWRGRSSDRVGLGAALERCIELIWPAFQPIVSAKDGSLYGYEALLRSDEPSFPHPGAILDAAERLNKLDALGRAMRRCSCLKFLEAEEGLHLFLNLHPEDLLDEDLLDPKSESGIIAKDIVLEITERSTLDKVPKVQERVASLREAGYRIAIDDLGAGYAGLTSFVQLEPEFVKLDMSLIRDVDKSRIKQGLVRSMTNLSKDMGLLVVAEGIETAEERDTVIGLGCDLLQGYLFGKPDRELKQPVW